MSFIDSVRKSSPTVLGDYLGNAIEGFLEGGFAEPGDFLVAAAAYLVLCVLWLVLLGVVSTVSDLVSRGGI